MHPTTRFHDLYHQLAHSWEAHQSFRWSQPGLWDLSGSPWHPGQDRLAMLDRHSLPSLERD